VVKRRPGGQAVILRAGQGYYGQSMATANARTVFSDIAARSAGIIRFVAAAD
jgi:hypothetical protein